jgi:hypothetical protein
MKKTFKIVTKVTSVKELEYIVEANSEEEALIILRDGGYRGEGDEVDEEIDWISESVKGIDLIED